MSGKTLKDYNASESPPPRNLSLETGDSDSPREWGTSDSLSNQRGSSNSMDSGEPASDGLGDFPFRLKSSDGGGWEISTALSTITDGADDTNLTITSLGTTGRTSTGQVYVDVTITAGAFASAAIVVGLFTAEVIIPTDVQTKAQLLIGSVGDDGDGGYILNQAIREARILTYGFVNGKYVRVFAAHPTHVGNL